VTEEESTHVIFSPVWASGYAESYLFGNIQRVLLLSATITKREAAYLGLKPPDFTYRAFPSPFDSSIRPVIVIKGGAVGRNMTVGEERMWLNKIDAIIDKENSGKNGPVKGIIHAVSYARAKLIKSRSRHASTMMIHERYNLARTVEQFKAAAAPAILVSPSVETGYDFPYSLARFQIIAKIPFVDSRSVVYQARHKADRRYLDHTAMVRLIQMAGRGVRAADDQCRCWIVDDNWSRWFYPRNRDLVPRWFKSAIRAVSSLDEVK
jgi:Rad3-related DNA helicase